MMDGWCCLGPWQGVQRNVVSSRSCGDKRGFGNRRAWSIKWPIETFSTVMANVPRCNLLLVLAPGGCFSLQRRGQSGSAVSWAGPRAGYLMTSPAQPARPDTIFKGCSMLIVPGTQQPTQAGRLPVKMPAHKWSPSSKARWQHWAIIML